MAAAPPTRLRNGHFVRRTYCWFSRWTPLNSAPVQPPWLVFRTDEQTLSFERSTRGQFPPKSPKLTGGRLVNKGPSLNKLRWNLFSANGLCRYSAMKVLPAPASESDRNIFITFSAASDFSQPRLHAYFCSNPVNSNWLDKKPFGDDFEGLSYCGAKSCVIESVV
jgi:hypothetical protein